MKNSESRNEYLKKWQENHIGYYKKWSQENKISRQVYNIKFRERNPNYLKKWRINHPQPPKIKIPKIPKILSEEELSEKREKLRIMRKKYRQTDQGKSAYLRSAKKYEKNNPDRRIAWNKAQKIKRLPCVICGKEMSVRHHPDISKPMEVVMLCHYHHIQAHKNMKLLKNEDSVIL